MLSHCSLFIGHVFRLDGNAQYAILAIDGNNFYFYFIAYAQRISCIFNTVNTDLEDPRS